MSLPPQSQETLALLFGLLAIVSKLAGLVGISVGGTSVVRWLLASADTMTGGLGARALSWSMALLVTAVSIGAGWLPAPVGQNLVAWAATLTPLVAILANWAYDNILHLSDDSWVDSFVAGLAPSDAPAAAPPAAGKSPTK